MAGLPTVLRQTRAHHYGAHRACPVDLAGATQVHASYDARRAVEPCLRRPGRCRLRVRDVPQATGLLGAARVPHASDCHCAESISNNACRGTFLRAKQLGDVEVSRACDMCRAPRAHAPRIGSMVAGPLRAGFDRSRSADAGRADDVKARGHVGALARGLVRPVRRRCRCVHGTCCGGICGRDPAACGLWYETVHFVANVDVVLEDRRTSPSPVLIIAQLDKAHDPSGSGQRAPLRGRDVRGAVRANKLTIPWR